MAACQLLGCDRPKDLAPLLGGKLLFIADREGAQTLEICTLQLPERTISTYSTQAGDLLLDDLAKSPRWSRDGKRICIDALAPRPGLYEFNTVDNSLRALVPEGEFFNGGTKIQEARYRDTDGVIISTKPPGLLVYHQVFAYGGPAGEIYAVVDYSIYKGIPEWSFSVDSVAIPEWMREHIRDGVGQGDLRWADLIQINTAGRISRVRRLEWDVYYGLSVSPNGDLIAYNNLDEIHVLSLTTGDILIPKLPDNFRPDRIAFSPNGQLLAVQGSVGDSYGVVFTISAPDFSTGVILEPTRRRGLWAMAWDPDSEWLMLGCHKGDYRTLYLTAVNVTTGSEVAIPYPFRTVSGADSRSRVIDGIDWTR